jgi:ABC-type sugar transport system ATPase subunit
MHLMKGEVLGLVGDNGAGKSTLIKILTGFVQPDDGKIFVNDQEVKLHSVTHARSLGIETVYQDLALVNQLTVYHNIFLKRELLLKPFPLFNNRAMREQAREYLKKIGVNIQSVDTEVAKLSGGQRQAIAIARAVYSNARILLLDEPLAAMGAKEGALILDLIHSLKEAGEVSMIMIAHNYGQVFEVCDRVNLLQHGTITLDKRIVDTSLEELNELVMREYRLAAASSQ